MTQVLPEYVSRIIASNSKILDAIVQRKKGIRSLANELLLFTKNNQNKEFSLAEAEQTASPEPAIQNPFDWLEKGMKFNEEEANEDEGEKSFSTYDAIVCNSLLTQKSVDALEKTISAGNQTTLSDLTMAVSKYQLGLLCKDSHWKDDSYLIKSKKDQITAATLFIAGKFDTKVPAKAMEATSNALNKQTGKSQYLLHEDSGHATFAEDPDWTFEKVTKFLSSTSNSPQ